MSVCSMSKKKKVFRPVRLEPSGEQPEKGPVFNREFSEAQKLARERYKKTQKRLRLARQFSKQGKPRLKKET